MARFLLAHLLVILIIARNKMKRNRCSPIKTLRQIPCQNNKYNLIKTISPMMSTRLKRYCNPQVLAQLLQKGERLKNLIRTEKQPRILIKVKQGNSHLKTQIKELTLKLWFSIQTKFYFHLLRLSFKNLP